MSDQLSVPPNKYVLEPSEELKRLLEPGKALKVEYGPLNINNEIRHIRAIVDEEWVVYKVWFRHKRRWHYAVAWWYEFELALQGGHLREVG